MTCPLLVVGFLQCLDGLPEYPQSLRRNFALMLAPLSKEHFRGCDLFVGGLAVLAGGFGATGFHDIISFGRGDDRIWVSTARASFACA